MPGLECPRCGLTYDGATIPQYLLSATGASCPRCAAPLTESPRQRGTTERSRPRAVSERHLAAVPRSVGWAEQAAAEGDFAGALAWLATVEAAGGPLPPGVDAKRRAWATAARRDGAPVTPDPTAA